MAVWQNIKQLFHGGLVNSKQLYHGCVVNSQNYCPEVTRMTMMDHCPRPKAEGNSPSWSSEAPRGNCFDYLSNTHEITVLLPNHN